MQLDFFSSFFPFFWPASFFSFFFSLVAFLSLLLSCRSFSPLRRWIKGLKDRRTWYTTLGQSSKFSHLKQKNLTMKFDLKSYYWINLWKRSFPLYYFTLSFLSLVLLYIFVPFPCITLHYRSFPLYYLTLSFLSLVLLYIFVRILDRFFLGDLYVKIWNLQEGSFKL